MWNGRLGKQVIEFINAEKPDFVCLQEVLSLPGGAAGWFLTPIEDLQAAVGMELTYAPFLDFHFMNRTAEIGIAVLSALPVASQSITFTGRQFIKDFDSLESDGNARNLLHTTFDSNGEALHVLTHHGHYTPGSKDGDEETMRQCGIIADYVAKLDGKVVLTGDFNLEPHSPSLEKINAALHNATIDYGLKTTYSKFGRLGMTCDYIFTNDAVKVLNFAMSDELLSDHAALVMEFE